MTARRDTTTTQKNQNLHTTLSPRNGLEVPNPSQEFGDDLIELRRNFVVKLQMHQQPDQLRGVMHRHPMAPGFTNNPLSHIPIALGHQPRRRIPSSISQRQRLPPRRRRHLTHAPPQNHPTEQDAEQPTRNHSAADGPAATRHSLGSNSAKPAAHCATSTQADPHANE